MSTDLGRGDLVTRAHAILREDGIDPDEATQDELAAALAQAGYGERGMTARAAEKLGPLDMFTSGTSQVDPDGLLLHVAAEDLLRQQGKLPGQYTADEYVIALEAAQQDRSAVHALAARSKPAPVKPTAGSTGDHRVGAAVVPSEGYVVTGFRTRVA